MRDLNLRDVPDEVVEHLERMAAAEGISVSAVAVRELAHSARLNSRARLDALPDLGIDPSLLVRELRTGRTARTRALVRRR